MARYDFARRSWQGPEDQGPQGSTLHGLGEIGEKFIGQFLGRAVDQALSKLGQLAADLRLDIVAQKGAAILLGQPDGGAAFGETGNATLAFARDLVAVGRIEIAQHDLALEAGGNRSDLHLGGGAKAVVFGLFQLLAAGDAGFQHCGIVEFSPHGLARRASTSPFIVMAMEEPPKSLQTVPHKARPRKGKAALG